MIERRDAALAPLTTLGLGGRARRLVHAFDDETVVEVVRAADQRGEPVLILGGGSNVVVADEGFAGVVVRVETRGLRAEERGEQALVEAAAGEEWDSLVATSVQAGLAGLEAMSGIPGRVGGSVWGSIGAYGQEVSEVVAGVRAYDRARGEVVELSGEECELSYRDSVFRRAAGRWVILSARYALEVSEQSKPVRYAALAEELGVGIGERAGSREVREAVLELRRRKGMVLDPRDPDTRSCGSFFTNPQLDEAALAALRARSGEEVVCWAGEEGRTKVSAAWLIEQAGFERGSIEGTVGISSKHTLALVHRGGGTSAALYRAARLIRQRVWEELGVELRAEPVLVGEEL